VVELGPGSGRLGGRVVASGTPSEIAACAGSPTGRALRGEFTPTGGTPRRGKDVLRLVGARAHNLRGVDLDLRFGQLTGLCGPSGSGKSTLALDVLRAALAGEEPRGRWQRLESTLDGASLRCVVVDAAPLGRTPASTPATYTGLLEPLRELFARTNEARARGLSPGHFSFNSPRGRCAACEGRGALRIEMQFLADLWLPCEECGGKRYAPAVLEARWRGKSIADVLELSVDEALEFLAAQPQAVAILRTLHDVGLGYLSLGQSSTTLSGGEAQRVKLASELLATEQAGRAVLLLDEPTTGLHASDVAGLVPVLQRLADSGHALLVIEHHPQLLASCDRLVELGPGGGAAGGRVIACGTPLELARDPSSVTGPFLPIPCARRSGAPDRPGERSRAPRGRRSRQVAR
jgi:excinuclease ABC subunit A